MILMMIFLLAIVFFILYALAVVLDLIFAPLCNIKKKEKDNGKSNNLH